MMFCRLFIFILTTEGSLSATRARFRSGPGGALSGLGGAHFPYRFLELILDGFFMDFGSIFDDFSVDCSMNFQSFF